MIYLYCFRPLGPGYISKYYFETTISPFCSLALTPLQRAANFPAPTDLSEKAVAAGRAGTKADPRWGVGRKGRRVGEG